MRALSDLQTQLARSLAGTLTAPGAGGEAGAASVEPAQLAHARAGLEVKRRRAAARLLPTIRAALGSRWRQAFERHARTYQPVGLLYHVDDAWEFAASWARHPDRTLRFAARLDVLSLRLHYVRSRRRHTYRIRERRWPMLVMTPGTLGIIVALPGVRPRLWRFPGTLPRPVP